MFKSKSIAGIFLMCGLTACAMPGPRAYYARSDISAQQQTKDDYECQRDARMLVNSSATVQINMFEQCMQARGYKFEPAK